MGEQIDLLASLPQTKRNVQARQKAKDPKVITIAKQYGEAYFDGLRAYGYGGYRYDGRWVRVAADIVRQYSLHSSARVLDVGCAKGFLVHDFMVVKPDMEAFGLDISDYALRNCKREVVGRLHKGTATDLPFPDESFDFVISLNTIHNLPREGAVRALQEIERVSKGKAFVQVDSYYTPEQKAIFESWVLTAEFHDYPDGWLKVFNEAGYTGDYNWTLV